MSADQSHDRTVAIQNDTKSSAVAKRPRELHVVKYVAKSLMVINIPLKLCRYLVPFLRYLSPKNGVIFSYPLHSTLLVIFPRHIRLRSYSLPDEIIQIC